MSRDYSTELAVLYEIVGEARRDPACLPTNHLVSIQLAQGDTLAFWHRAGKATLNKASMLELLLDDAELESFPADQVAIIGAIAAVRDTRLELERRKQEALQRLQLQQQESPSPHAH